MGLFDKFKSITSEQRYSAIIESRKEIIKTWSPKLPLEIWWIFWDSDLNKEVNKISEKDFEYYVRSRFLASIFMTIGMLQKKARRNSSAIQSFQQQDSPLNVVKEMNQVDALNLILNSNDPALLDEIKQNFAVAISMLAKSPDVDINVACDLGKGDGYPERPLLPNNIDSQHDQFFRVASLRAKFFWQHVTRFPLPHMLEILTGFLEIKGVELETSLMKKLVEIKEKIVELPQKYPSEVKVFGINSSITTINTICDVCDLSISALKEGRDEEVADGLKRLANDAYKDTGLIATILNPQGVSQYTQYINEISELSKQIRSGEKKI